MMGKTVSYPRRQQFRRLARAGAFGAAALVAALLGLLALTHGELAPAVVLLLAAVGLAIACRHWLGLAARAGVGARSEAHVRRTLAALEREGWRIRHSLNWQGPGDIDSIAIAPTGLAFAIEVQTRSYTPDHLARVTSMACWLRARRGRWCPNGALPVLCIAEARSPDRIEAGVLVTSRGQLLCALRTAAGTQTRPPFLTPGLDTDRRGEAR